MSRKRKNRDKLFFTDFEKEVYRCVLKIPLGKTKSYKWVAEKIGRPRAVRAVGRALAKNPFPLFIPCHRVVRKDKDWGGYSGGRKEKERLIKLEKKIRNMIK